VSRRNPQNPLSWRGEKSRRQTSPFALCSVRLARGSIILVAAMTFVIVCIGLMFLYMMMHIGGTAELQHSVDAGALNVARRSLTDRFIRITEMPDDYFLDCCARNESVCLENINHCIAKTMLVGINEMSMERDGQCTPASLHNTVCAFDETRDLTNKLNTRLSDNTVLSKFFTDLANSNTPRMFGTTTTVQLKGTVQRAWNDAGERSSICVKPEEWPAEFPTDIVPTLEDGSKKKWLPGYLPIEINGHVFFFVPQPVRPPHLVSQVTYAQSSVDPVRRTKALPDKSFCIPIVPNVYRVVGSVLGGTEASKSVQAIACSQADALRDGFPMNMPHGFVRIIHTKPVYEIKLYSNVDVKTPRGTFGMWDKVIGSGGPQLQKSAAALKLKIESEPRNAWDIFMGPGRTDMLSHLRTKLMQRVKEIIPGTEDTTVDPPLPQTHLKEGTNAVIFQTEDQSRFRVISPELGTEVPFDMGKLSLTPDGTSGRRDMTVVKTDEIINPPPACDPKKDAVAVWIEEHYTYNWKPGTGVNGNLGDFQLGRKIVLKFLQPGREPDPQLKLGAAKL
jgi:hypothetical protein